tara:strand:+ start:2604 stop:2927 length:324 start_codon:yes stop_codon:yes gene_type:complete
MPQTPMENYKEYIQLMDSMTIHEELQKINAIHHSLNEKNPMTYVILRETHKDKWTPSQLEWLDNQIDRLQESIRQNFENSLQSVDVELAKASILDKSSDQGEVRKLV